MGKLKIQNLGKAYKRYNHKWERLAEWLGNKQYHQIRWVLRDINLNIESGAAVGIIGVNGAGKSTLLKLIAGTSYPTEGSIQYQGRLAALLELGIGFHGEFTGRQNVWITSSLAGWDHRLIAERMTEIADFADIGDYFDQPVRTYSSGMQVRLAFAVATAVRPEILLVDEALAVGDIFFQQKCFARIRAFREEGTTLLFVSHALSTVYALCERAILLEGGRIKADGEPRKIIDLYNADLANRLGSGDLTIADGSNLNQPAGSYDCGAVVIERVMLLQDERPVQTIISDSVLVIEITVFFKISLADPHVGFQVRDRRGEAVYMTHTHGLGHSLGSVSTGERIQIRYGFAARLIPGEYSITVGVAEGGLPDGQLRTSLTRCQDVTSFTVTRNFLAAHWDGMYNLQPSCEIQRLTFIN